MFAISYKLFSSFEILSQDLIEMMLLFLHYGESIHFNDLGIYAQVWTLPYVPSNIWHASCKWASLSPHFRGVQHNEFIVGNGSNSPPWGIFTVFLLSVLYCLGFEFSLRIPWCWFFLFFFSAITWKMPIRSLLIVCPNYLEVRFLMEGCVPFSLFLVFNHSLQFNSMAT